MFTRREWSDEARQVINEQLNRIQSDIGSVIGTPKRSQREAMLGVTQGKLAMSQSPSERANILSGARDYITGGSSFNLKGSQRRQLGALGRMALSGGPSEGELAPSGNQATSYPQVGIEEEEGMEQGGIIPGKVNPNTGDDTVIKAKKGEYVIPTEVVDYVGVEKLDKLVSGAKKNLGLKRKPASGGYQEGGGEVQQRKISDKEIAELGYQREGSAPGYIKYRAASEENKARGIRYESDRYKNRSEVEKDILSRSYRQGYEAGGEVTKEKDLRAFVETGQEGAPVQAVEKTPTGDYAGAVISPEAANKLYKAWGLDKESPNWQPEYGVQATATSPGGSRTTQVIQPGPGGVMPGVELPSGRKIPMGLSRPAFEERAAEEDIISRIPKAKEKAAYLTEKEKAGIERRKVAAEEELIPFKKAELQARTLKHGRAPEKKESNKPPWQVEKKFEMLSNRAKELASEQKELAKNPFAAGYTQQRDALKKERASVQAQLDDIIKGGTGDLGRTPPATSTKPVSQWSFSEFESYAKSKGTKMNQKQLRAEYAKLGNKK